jgi:CheY-like chemotaxis protein
VRGAPASASSWGTEGPLASAWSRARRDALARLDQETFDVILCDVSMPTMTGLDVHEALLARHPRMAQRMVFMTGGAITSRIGEFLAANAERQVAKPFEGPALRMAIATAASRR